MKKLYLQNVVISLLIVFVGITIIPSFATTHNENFAQFYTNQTIYKGDTIFVNNTDNQSYQVDGDGFGSGSISYGGTYSHTFNSLGQIAIMDDLHRGVIAYINVIDPTIQPVIYTNSTSYKTGDIVDIYGTGLFPTTHQSVTIYDSNGQIAQVLQTPIISDRTMFLPITIPALGSTGEWKVVLIQNGQVITNSFMVTQGLILAKNNDTGVSSPIITFNESNSTQNNSNISNYTQNNTIVTQVASNKTLITNDQKIQALSDKIDSLETKIDGLKTQDLSLFGLVTKLAHFFGLN